MTEKIQIDGTKSYFCKYTKIWHGVKDETKLTRHDTIGSLALKAMLDDPERIAQICYQTGKKFTNSEIANLTVQIAQHYQKLQLQQGDIVGMCVSNSDYMTPVFYGSLVMGLTISTLDPSFDKAGIKHIYAMSRPRVMFCDVSIYHTVKKAFEEIELSATTIYTIDGRIEGVPSVLDIFRDSFEIGNFRAPVLKNGSNHLAMIVCTSGTTGPPKGVFMTHGALLNYAQIGSAPCANILCFSTLYWVSGIVFLITGTLTGNTRIMSEKPFAADDFLDIVERYKVSYISSTPAQVALTLSSERLATTDLSSIRMLFCGGSAVPYALIEKFKRFAPNAKCIVMYGMSEICSSIAYGECQPNNAVGRLYANMEVKIIDDDGNHLGPNETGEICVRSQFPWAGYLKNPEATKATCDKNGFIHSGDVGYFNDEGLLYLVDRKKDILKYNNFHFSPTEIEKVISELPQVAEVCVAGIPDITYTFLPAAAVTLCRGASIKESDICEHVAQRMQHFEQLRGGAYICDSLPKTVSGKTLRNKVAEICCARRNAAKG